MEDAAAGPFSGLCGACIGLGGVGGRGLRGRLAQAGQTHSTRRHVQAPQSRCGHGRTERSIPQAHSGLSLSSRVTSLVKLATCLKWQRFCHKRPAVPEQGFCAGGPEYVGTDPRLGRRPQCAHWNSAASDGIPSLAALFLYPTHTYEVRDLSLMI